MTHHPELFEIKDDDGRPPILVGGLALETTFRLDARQTRHPEATLTRVEIVTDAVEIPDEEAKHICVRGLQQAS